MTEIDKKRVTFPLRVAAIDVGSNALRMLAAEFVDELHYAVLASERYPLRLGHDVFLTGKISGESMRNTVECLAGFHRQAKSLGIELYRAVATSAVRESENAEELLFRVRDGVGVNLERISGYEEARLVHLAVRRRVRMGSRQWVLADLGGGSVEVSLVEERGVLWSESHNMGSVRLLEELAGTSEDPGRFAKLLTEYVATLRVPSAVRGKPLAGLIATGGNIEALFTLAGMPGRDEVGVLKLDELRAIIERLANLSYAERMKQLGLRADRADVILPAALVFERLAVLLGVQEILVPQVGLKEGIVCDLVDGLSRREDLWDRQTIETALSLGRKYLFDEPHALHVSRLALSLFDQLKKVHRLVANAARYHRKTPPSPHHPLFTELSSADRDRVWKLASILRTADALDREHLQRVTDVIVSVDGNTARITLRGTGDLLLERWALQKKVQLFSDYFGLKTSVQVER
jgi:exopolyphosphatase/guanosine-5'-triphosphate,3'-diphosphate pyrophosphatase